MINEMTNEEILAASQELKNCCQVIRRLIENRDVQDLEDFVASVDMYTKYLDNTIELIVAADLALKKLVESKK